MGEPPARKAVSCYEKGFLADNYDETGANCGKGYDASEDSIIWLTSGSDNLSIETQEVSFRVYDYLGGHAVETKCLVTFINAAKDKCNFEMSIDLGTEDGNINIYNLKCF